MTTTTTATNLGKGTHTMEAVADVSAAIRGQKWSGVGVVTNHHPRWKNCSTGGDLGTPTSTRMGGKNWHISSSSAGNSFGSVKHLRKRYDQNNPSQAHWLTMHPRRHLTHHQTRCNMAIRPPRSSTSSNLGSRSSRKKHSRHHAVSCL
jgi:hypothetical protein